MQYTNNNNIVTLKEEKDGGRERERTVGKIAFSLSFVNKFALCV